MMTPEPYASYDHTFSLTFASHVILCISCCNFAWCKFVADVLERRALFWRFFGMIVNLRIDWTSSCCSVCDSFVAAQRKCELLGGGGDSYSASTVGPGTSEQDLALTQATVASRKMPLHQHMKRRHWSLAMGQQKRQQVDFSKSVPEQVKASLAWTTASNLVSVGTFVCQTHIPNSLPASTSP